MLWLIRKRDPWLSAGTHLTMARPPRGTRAAQSSAIRKTLRLKSQPAAGSLTVHRNS
jgi:hypothetical protein